MLANSTSSARSARHPVRSDRVAALYVHRARLWQNAQQKHHATSLIQSSSTGAQGWQLHATSQSTGAAEAVPNTSSQAAPDPTADIPAAWAFLKDFSIKTFRGLGAQYTSTPEQRQQLRDVLKFAYSNPWPDAGWVPPPAAAAAAASQPQPAAAASSPAEAPAGSPPALVMIGLMASDVQLAARAMRDYCGALGLPYSKPESRVAGVAQAASVGGNVYMKYNSMSQVCYVVNYLGKERGVLIQMGQEQLGHFPLGLWDEEMKGPPAPL